MIRVACALFLLAAASASAQLKLGVHTELWWMDINYDPPENAARDGDAYLWTQGLDIGCACGTSLGLSFGLGKEEYERGQHTDLHNGRIELTRAWQNLRVGLGFNYWNNDYSNGGSTEEFGPTVLLAGHTGELGWNTRAALGLVWQPIDLGDAEEFEFYELDGLLERDCGRFSLQLGYRLKNYYESRDDYLYHGPFFRGLISF